MDANPRKRSEARFDNGLRYRDADDPGQWHFTPDYVLVQVRRDLGGVIDLDPCTESDNPTGAEHFYTADQDGERMPWVGENGERWTIFCNPPYGKAREPWVRHCVDAARWYEQRVILLIPAATDTRIFRVAAESADAVVFLTGRVKFGTRRDNGRQFAASHPSALIGWNTPLAYCKWLGWRAVPT